jgi:hypothetical protein
MKHPLRKIFESGADPVDRRSSYGMTNRPNAIDRAVENLEAHQQETARQNVRLAKEYKKEHIRFIDQLQWWLNSYPKTGETRLPFSIVDPQTKTTIIPSEGITRWSERDINQLISQLRQAFASHQPSRRFPFSILDSATGHELAGPTTLLMKTAVYILHCPMRDNFRNSVKDVLHRQGHL